MFNNTAWLTQVIEEIVDPDRDIVDPHHHLWPEPSMAYNLTELLGDTTDGHKVSHCLLYTSPSPRDRTRSRMPSSA